MYFHAFHFKCCSVLRQMKNKHCFSPLICHLVLNCWNCETVYLLTSLIILDLDIQNHCYSKLMILSCSSLWFWVIPADLKLSFYTTYPFNKHAETKSEYRSRSEYPIHPDIHSMFPKVISWCHSIFNLHLQ